MQKLIEKFDKTVFLEIKTSLLKANAWFSKYGNNMTLEFGSIHDTKWQKTVIDGKQLYRKVINWKIFLMIERDLELTNRYIKSITYYPVINKRQTFQKKLKPPFLIEKDTLNYQDQDIPVKCKIKFRLWT